VDAERVLAGLDPEQRAAAQAVRGPVCILAGAGTGKTRAITHRIAYAVRTEAIPPGQHRVRVAHVSRSCQRPPTVPHPPGKRDPWARSPCRPATAVQSVQGSARPS
jgi:hypothetical protein